MPLFEHADFFIWLNEIKKSYSSPIEREMEKKRVLLFYYRYGIIVNHRCRHQHHANDAIMVTLLFWHWHCANYSKFGIHFVTEFEQIAICI